MAEDIYGLNESDLEMLREAVTLIKGQRLDAPNRPTNTNDEDTDYITPEVYVVYSGGGIPGVGPFAGTGTDPVGPTGCQVYRMSVTGGVYALEDAGFGQPEVFNLSPSDIGPGQWALATRDKFGTWWAVASGGGGTPGSGDIYVAVNYFNVVHFYSTADFHESVNFTSTSLVTFSGTTEYDSSSNTTFDGPVKLCGYQFWCCKSLTLTTSSYDNLALLGPGTVFSATVTSDTLITGIVAQTFPGGGSGGPQIIAITNTSATYLLKLIHDDPGSSAANRIFVPPAHGISLNLAQYDSAILWYDTCHGSHWRVLATTVVPSSGGGGTAPQLYKSNVTGGNYTVTASMADAGCTFSIASAGTYLVWVYFSYNILLAGTKLQTFTMRLWDTTNNLEPTANAYADGNYTHSIDDNNPTAVGVVNKTMMRHVVLTLGGGLTYPLTISLQLQDITAQNTITVYSRLMTAIAVTP